METSVLNEDSRKLLTAIFGSTPAWLVRGHYDATDKLNIQDEGPVRSFPLPDVDDLYYCVASIAPGNDRKTVDRVWVLVVDDIGKEIDKQAFDMLFPLQPSFVVESSKGSYQVGFIIDGGMEPDEYRALRRAMKGSPLWGKAHNIAPAAIYRLPQGTHTKSTKGGWKVRLVSLSDRRYTPEELFRALAGGALGAPAIAMPGTAIAVGADTVGDMAVLEKLVAIIPNPVKDWDFMVDVGRAIWGASEGLGFEVFEAWAASLSTGEADPEVTRGRWDSYRDSSIGRYWLIREARQADPAATEAWLRDEAKLVFDDMGLDPPPEGEGGGGAPATAGVDPVQGMVAASIRTVLGGSMRFNLDSGCWHVFRRGIWEPQPRSRKEGFLKAEAWAQQNRANLPKAAYKEVMKSTFYNGIETILQQTMSIRNVEFDTNIWLSGTREGFSVDLLTGALKPSDPKDFISKALFTAPSERVDCPRWLRFIAEITKGDRAAALFLQQWAGYNLTGDIREQMFLFLYGPGKNGKSKYVDTLATLMGDYFVKPVGDLYFKKTHERHMQEVAMLSGARMVTMSEVPSGAQWDEGRLKDHTGGGRITANFMRENSFSFTPQFKLTVYGNHQPTFPGGINPAIRRRFRMMLLDFTPPVEDKDLEAKLIGEAPGILRWMLDGLTHPTLGWHAVRLMIPKAVEDVTDAFVLDQDLVERWLDERVGKLIGGFVSATDLFNDWQSWKASNGGGLLSNSVVEFISELERKGLKRRRKITARGFEGIVLKSKTNSPF